ncbi:hypothetical protein LBMAG43_00360 [Methylococcaceae bacterium]|nr:hypothetical protein LBMAG43_00360 [Methylococcaceae bacterium]
MDATKTTFTGYPIFEPSKQELEKSRWRGALMLGIVVTLHTVLTLYLLNSSENEPKKSPTIMAVEMLTLPKPILKEQPLLLPAVKPVVKKEIVKPQPIVKPVPVKQITPPKPVLQPRILTTAPENAQVSIPKFETAPNFTPAVPAQTVTKTVETSSTSNEISASSGGTCENCGSIEKRLQRRYARRNFTGLVSFIFIINENGKVQNASVKSSEPLDMFDEDVISEIKESLIEMEFVPKTVNGKAVSFKGAKTIKFQPS